MKLQEILCLQEQIIHNYHYVSCNLKRSPDYYLSEVYLFLWVTVCVHDSEQIN